MANHEITLEQVAALDGAMPSGARTSATGRRSRCGRSKGATVW